MPGTPYNAHSLPTPPHSTTKYATIGFCFSHFIVFCVCNAVICYDRTTVSDASSLHEALWYTEEVYKHILELFFNLVYFAQTFDTSIDIGFALPSITWNLTLAMELWSPDFHLACNHVHIQVCGGVGENFGNWKLALGGRLGFSPKFRMHARGSVLPGEIVAAREPSVAAPAHPDEPGLC